MKIKDIYNKLTLGIVAMAALCLTSCAGENELEPGLSAGKSMATVPASISIAGDATSTQFTVNADCEWRFSNVSPWMTLSDMSGFGSKTITITTTANPSAIEARTGSISFEAGDRSKTITVTQSASSESISFASEQIDFTAATNTLPFAVKANCNWKVLSTPEWISISPMEGTGDTNINITVTENATEDTREDFIYIQSGNKNVTKSFKVSQAGVDANLMINTSSLTVTASKGTATLTLTGNAKWTAYPTNEWITIDKTEGQGGCDIKISCSDNISSGSRSGQVIITYKKGQLTCNIRQEAGKAATVSEVTASDINKYSFTATATFTSEFPLSDYGFCYSATSYSPTEKDGVVSFTGNPASSSFSATIDKLESGKTYYVRAYANNGVNTTYGEVLKVTTLGGKPENGDNPDPSL